MQEATKNCESLNLLSDETIYAVIENTQSSVKQNL